MALKQSRHIGLPLIIDQGTLDTQTAILSSVGLHKMSLQTEHSTFKAHVSQSDITNFSISQLPKRKEWRD